MNNSYPKYKQGDGIGALWRSLTKGRHLDRGAAFGMMILGALLAFEIFNFSSTQFALRDMLGNLEFAGIAWATILAIAFCGIDFAGIARIFTPEQGRDEPKEVWYLFGAWLLAAGFNAALTWWGVSVAIASHSSAAAGTVMSGGTLTKVVPIFVAIMVWLIRVLIIGAFSMAGDRLFSTASASTTRTPYNAPRPMGQNNQQPVYRPSSNSASLRPASSIARPAPKPMTQSSFNAPRPEPTYHSTGPANERNFNDPLN